MSIYILKENETEKKKQAILSSVLSRTGQKNRYPDHDTWRKAWQKRRNTSMMISGRKDAAQGNFRFRYDTDKHALTYISQDGTKIMIPDVAFPYGQEEINKAVNADKDHRKAVAWRIILSGSGFYVQCIADVEEPEVLTSDFRHGVIGMDSNVDNLSISETDQHGNVLRHKVIRFNLEEILSGHAEQVLSSALEEVFRLCRETDKPLVMEELKLKHTADRYASKRRNYKTNRFAFRKITNLTESKSFKKGIMVKKVDPAYTSQQGKILFMKKHGMSIHEAASAVIARQLYDQLKPYQRIEPRVTQ